MSSTIATLLRTTQLERLDAEILLAEVLGVTRSYLYTWPEKVLSSMAYQQFQQFTQRRFRGEPIAYITGRKGFWTLELEVTPATLIPRPETELLVEQALQRMTSQQVQSVADLGTGSGAIALSIATENPHSQLTATDQNPQTIQIAARNAIRLKIPNVQFLVCDWLSAFHPASFDMIVSNPPYIKVGDLHLQQLTYEPQQALVSGKTGLNAINLLVANAKYYLKAGGWLLLEHGYEQATAVQQHFQHSGYEQITTYLDLAGLPRVTVGQCLACPIN